MLSQWHVHQQLIEVKTFMIALLCSVQAEAEHLHSKLQVHRTATAGSKAIVQGMLFGQRVLLCAGGMGKVNAAHTATVMITEFDPEALNVSASAAPTPRQERGSGTWSLPRRDRRRRRHTDHDGFKDTEYIGIPLLKTASRRSTHLPAAQPLLERSLRAAARRARTGETCMPALRHPLDLHRHVRAGA